MLKIKKKITSNITINFQYINSFFNISYNVKNILVQDLNFRIATPVTLNSDVYESNYEHKGAMDR